MSAEAAFGIDIGGSGMKAAPVDLATGELTRRALQDRHAEAGDTARRWPTS